MRLHRISNGEIPPENKYVLIYCENEPWGDDDDKSCLWKVARYAKGISMAEREEMKRSNDPQKVKRANTYCGEDEWGNNKVPYCFEEFGFGKWFGQNIDIWCELPEVSKGE